MSCQCLILNFVFVNPWPNPKLSQIYLKPTSLFSPISPATACNLTLYISANRRASKGWKDHQKKNPFFTKRNTNTKKQNTPRHWANDKNPNLQHIFLGEKTEANTKKIKSCPLSIRGVRGFFWGSFFARRQPRGGSLTYWTRGSRITAEKGVFRALSSGLNM